MKGLHISVTCAALFVIVALVAYHLGGGGKCREGFRENQTKPRCMGPLKSDKDNWYEGIDELCGEKRRQKGRDVCEWGGEGCLWTTPNERSGSRT